MTRSTTVYLCCPSPQLKTSPLDARTCTTYTTHMYVQVHMNLYMYVCVSAFWWQDIRLYANISVCLFVYCLLFPICVCSIWKLEKFFIHTDICKYVFFFIHLYITYTSCWSLALRERHSLKPKRNKTQPKGN